MGVLVKVCRSVILLIAMLLVACVPAPRPEKTATYVLTQIVDDETEVPIEDAKVTFTLENLDGSVLREWVETDIQEYETGIPIGTVLKVLAEAEGYNDWELHFTVKAAKPFSMPVRMIPLAMDTQG